MAGSDYMWCSACGTKTFYDASVDYEWNTHDVACLCKECGKTFEIIVRRIKSKKTKRREDNFR